MPAEFAAFAFIITLAAVINGLGIVRWVGGFAEFLQRKDSVEISFYWVYVLAAGFQFVLHVLLWWSLWIIRGFGSINFLTYLYLLTGPILLFLGTAFLTPNLADAVVDLKKHFNSVRPTYTNILVLVWLWAIFTSPVFLGSFSPQASMYAVFLGVALLQLVTANSMMQAVMALANWVLLAIFIVLYGMQLGGNAA
jgi:hypothetical protein